MGTFSRAGGRGTVALKLGLIDAMDKDTQTLELLYNKSPILHSTKLAQKYQTPLQNFSAPGIKLCYTLII